MYVLCTEAQKHLSHASLTGSVWKNLLALPFTLDACGRSSRNAYYYHMYPYYLARSQAVVVGV